MNQILCPVTEKAAEASKALTLKNIKETFTKSKSEPAATTTTTSASGTLMYIMYKRVCLKVIKQLKIIFTSDQATNIKIHVVLG